MKLKLVLGVVILGILAVSGLGLYVTSQPNFCQSCHEMKNDFKAWQSSAHKDVNCTSCHIGPGFVNLITHKVKASKEVIAHLTGNFETPINKGSKLSQELPSAYCTACHKSPGKESNERLVFDHSKHKNANFNCSYCHSRVAHPDIKEYSSRITMDFCVDCHKKKSGSLECSTCHPAEFKLKPASHTSGEWLGTHGKSDFSKCSDCHFDKDSFCTDCHGVQMPHPEGWPSAHGKDSSLLSNCSMCHDQKSFCAGCHG